MTAAERGARAGPGWRASASVYTSAHYGTAGHALSTVAPARPKSAADIAQAHRFDEILQGEMAELLELAAGIEARSSERHEPHYIRELQLLNIRIDEVRRLLDSLRDRFGPM